MMYNREFKNLADKLMKPPAILSNAEAVKAYLVPMSERLYLAISARLSQNVTHVQLLSRRREDHYLLSEVMEAAASPDFRNLNTYYGNGARPTGSQGVPDSAETYSRGALSFRFSPHLPETTPADPVKVEPKQEEVSEVLAGIASIKDTIALNRKETNLVLDGHQKAISSMMSLMKDNIESKRSGYTSTQVTAPQNTSKTIPDWGQGCFMCGSLEHRMSECQFFNSYKDKGWLVPDTAPGSKKYTLRDGTPLPRNDPSESRPEKIARIAKSKGWDKGGTNAFFVKEEDYLDTKEQEPHFTSFLASMKKLMEEHETNGRYIAGSGESKESGN